MARVASGAANWTTDVRLGPASAGTLQLGMQRSRAFVALILVLTSLACAASLTSVTLASDAPRYLIFHVDAVSAADFDRALLEGRLPNVARAFEGGSRSEGVSTFLANTPVIYPLMHDGSAYATPGRVGFGGWDRNTARPVTEAEIFLELLAALPRRATTNLLLHGVPYLDWLAGLAMQNVPELLERYQVVEFFWFATDSFGHLSGEQGHARALERFDANLGRLLPRLDLDTLNLILYTDHGMTFTTETVDLEGLVERRVGERAVYYSYPNLYLSEAGEAPELARLLASPGGVDFAFYRASVSTVEGYLDGAFVRFESEGDRLRYVSVEDPLGYVELGYGGEPLTPEEWLDLTIDARYPGVPPSVFRYVQNPNTGDVVLGLNPPRIPLTVRANRGNHAGLVDSDVRVPILFRGPDLDVLEGRERLWLHDLYRDLPVVTTRPQPSRELNEIALWWRADEGVPGVRARFSAAYRVRLAGEVSRLGWAAWSEHDLFSSYLTRWWVGVGVSQRQVELQPMARGEAQLDLGDVRVSFEARYHPGEWTFGLGVAFRVGQGVRLSWLAPGGLGASFEW